MGRSRRINFGNGTQARARRRWSGTRSFKGPRSSACSARTSCTRSGWSRPGARPGSPGRHVTRPKSREPWTRPRHGHRGRQADPEGTGHTKRAERPCPSQEIISFLRFQTSRDAAGSNRTGAFRAAQGCATPNLYLQGTRISGLETQAKHEHEHEQSKPDSREPEGETGSSVEAHFAAARLRARRILKEPWAAQPGCSHAPSHAAQALGPDEHESDGTSDSRFSNKHQGPRRARGA